jgi:hypothetical protein
MKEGRAMPSNRITDVFSRYGQEMIAIDSLFDGGESSLLPRAVESGTSFFVHT